MQNKIRSEILAMFETQKIDMLDIHLVQNFLLDQKMYDLLVYINNNLADYVSFIKSLKNQNDG